MTIELFPLSSETHAPSNGFMGRYRANLRDRAATKSGGRLARRCTSCRS